MFQFKPSHGAYQQATLVADGSFGHGLHHPYLQCLGRLGATTRIIEVNEKLPSVLGGKDKRDDGEEISATVIMLAHIKVTGVKTCHSTTTTFTLLIMMYFSRRDFLRIGRSHCRQWYS